MAVFIKKHKKILLVFVLVISIGSFLISYFNKNKNGNLDVKFCLEQCEADTGYSVAYEVEADYHKEKTISHFSVDGAIEESDNVFRRTSDEITVYHVLDTDINNILDSQNKINYDNWDGDVYTADFNNQKIGKGAIFIEVFYLDDFKNQQSETIFYTDILDGAVKDSKKEIIKIEKKECDIRILLVYEVTDKLETFNDDFRVNYYFSIRNGSKDIYAKTIGPDKDFAGEVPASTPVNTDILPESTVFNGFRLDYAGNQFYTTAVYRNDRLLGVYDYVSIRSVYFSEEGLYRIININAFNEESEFYLTIDRYKPSGTFLNLDYENIFSGFTVFKLNEPQGGFSNRSPVTVAISKNGGSFKQYHSGELIRETGAYSIRLKNEFYEIFYNFTVIETIIPTENYLSLLSLNKNIAPVKYYAFDVVTGFEKLTYCFAINSYEKAYQKSMGIERAAVIEEICGGETTYYYKDGVYYSVEDLTGALNAYIEQNIYVKYTDIESEENLIFDPEIFSGSEILYLNNFYFDSRSPIYSDRVYYLRQEDYPNIKELDLKTAKQYGKVFEYGVPVENQLELSGTYLILDANIYEHTFVFKAYFVNNNNAVIKIDYARNGSFSSGNVEALENGLPAFVDYFKINSITDKYDPYTVVKVAFENQTDYFMAGDVFKKYSDEGIYRIVCYDRNFNRFEFEITVKNPLGNNIILEGAEPFSETYDDFKIYFNINCNYFKVVENTSLLIEIVQSEIVKNSLVIEYDDVQGLYFITIKRKAVNTLYSIAFTNEDGNLIEFYILMIS